VEKKTRGPPQKKRTEISHSRAGPCEKKTQGAQMGVWVTPPPFKNPTHKSGKGPPPFEAPKGSKPVALRGTKMARPKFPNQSL